MEKFLRFKTNPIEVSESENKAKIVLEPLEKGFGTTLGNALRRICLSNIPGVSIFAIKIPDVTHEFQAIEGVYEDVISIILNLKRLVIKGDLNVLSEEELNGKTIEEWPTLKINFKGPGNITARDIEVPAGFTIVNPDLHIASITKARDFQMEIYAKWGRGFKTSEENKESITTLSIIPTDSNFSPVLAFNYKVNDVKTSKISTSDSLELDVATNGAISASDAIVYAAKILSDHLEPIMKLNDAVMNLQVLNDEFEEQRKTSLFIPIEDLDLTVRAYNALRSSGILTTHELIEKSKQEIEKIKNLGRKSVNEIIQKIHERGLKLRDE
ncbi:DNA-directed RNA polymerase subunit alpha [Ureaplasma ceti]|uniref:DNA-directed RNA polymerase subunit alpha n=1 Tax=Ureaplasma ceti TaxID=3119530 RepID=A0ABP9U533_9BACT